MVELIILFFFCGLLGLGCLGALGWVLFTPEEIGVERIFLLLVSALLGALFLGMAAWIARYTRLRELWKPATATQASKAGATPAPEEAAAREKMEKPAS